MKHTLVAAAFLLTIAALDANAQTAKDLSQRYGNPDSEGYYKVRAAVRMTVGFDDQSQASKIVIEPLYSVTGGNDPHSSVMSEARVMEILDEVAPVARRGKSLKRGIFGASCISVHFEQYEHVTIAQTIRCEFQGGGTYRLNVLWK